MQSLSADHAGGECETIHPLHPYDADYFGSNSPLFSYSHRYLQVAQAQQRGLRIADVHTEFAVDTAEEATTTDLTRWLWHPARALFREHLGVDFEVGANPLRDRLVHTEDPLRAWAVANDVLDLLAQDVSDAEVMAYVKHTPDLTTGSVGAVHRAQLLDEIARFETVTAGLPRSETTRNETSIAGMRLRYQVELNPKGVRTAVRFVRGGRRYDLQVWIEHLLLGVAQKNFTATLMVCRSTGALPQRIGYAKVEDSVTELERIVALYQQARRERLPLLPGASRVYAEARHTGRGHDDALHKAHKAFLQSNGAVEDRYIAALWPEGSPFVEHETAFADCAMQLYAPLLHHQRLL